MSETDIIKQCQKNNKQAQKHLFENNYNWLMHLSLRYGNNEEQAKKILYTGYSKIISSIEDYNESVSFDKWMKKIFIDSAVNFLKEQKKEFFVTTTVHLKEVNPHGTYVKPNQSEEAFSIDGKDVLSAIQQLPPSFRSMFNMCVIDELEMNDAAKILEISTETAKINLEKATFLFHQNLNKNKLANA
jgi:RNA polymerase sigma-70 factor (ECF subfamily)